jgi:hypothetical protein
MTVISNIRKTGYKQTIDKTDYPSPAIPALE